MNKKTGPVIPAEEYPQRWARAQCMMQQEKLDLWVADADDRATFGPVDVFKRRSEGCL